MSDLIKGVPGKHDVYFIAIIDRNGLDQYEETVNCYEESFNNLLNKRHAMMGLRCRFNSHRSPKLIAGGMSLEASKKV